MKRLLPLAVALFLLIPLSGCKKSGSADTPTKALTAADLAAMANAVPNSGPRDGNAYQVFFLVFRQDQRPAAGFPIDVWVKGKGEKKTIRTDNAGLATVSDLPFPDAKHPLEAVLHYFKGNQDQEREITYPFIESDAYRLKDVQYIPNTVTPDPQ
jgi:hypothetical protein